MKTIEELCREFAHCCRDSNADACFALEKQLDHKLKDKRISFKTAYKLNHMSTMMHTEGFRLRKEERKKC